MSQFKRFNASEHGSWDSNIVLPEGTLTWDPNNGLRLHDGNNNGGRTVGVNSFWDLNNRPSGSSALHDLIGGSGSTDNGRFYMQTDMGQAGWCGYFRVVDNANVHYPNGLAGLGTTVGDVAFDANYIYRCNIEPNTYGTVSVADGRNWVPSNFIKISSLTANGRQIYQGDILTDGTTTVTVNYTHTNWDGTYQLIEISQGVDAWHNGSTTSLTILSSGTTANTNCWSRFPALGAVPAHSYSDGVAGQLAVDNNYLYHCVTSSVAGVSYEYDAPAGRNTSPFNWPNQSDSTSLRLFARGDSVTPQIGWTVSDGTNNRTITNVVTQNSGFGVIHDLTLSSAVDYSTAITLTVYQVYPTEGGWKRIAFSNDTW